MTYPKFILLLSAATTILGCGPGASDYEENIVNGYSFLNAGHHERVILHTGTGGKKIVVDARVDDYKVQDNLLLVARRPRLIDVRDSITTSDISDDCEFVAINIVTGHRQQMPYSHELSCN